MSLADASLVRMAELYQHASIFTLDRIFGRIGSMAGNRIPSSCRDAAVAPSPGVNEPCATTFIQ